MVTVFDGIALIVFLVTFSNSVYQFRQPFFINEHTGRDNGKTTVAGGTVYLAQFLFGNQQFAVAACDVIIIGTK